MTSLVSSIKVSDKFVDYSIHVENDEGYKVLDDNKEQFVRAHYENVEKAIVENMPIEILLDLKKKVDSEILRRKNEEKH